MERVSSRCRMVHSSTPQTTSSKLSAAPSRQQRSTTWLSTRARSSTRAHTTLSSSRFSRTPTMVGFYLLFSVNTHTHSHTPPTPQPPKHTLPNLLANLLATFPTTTNKGIEVKRRKKISAAAPSATAKSSGFGTSSMQHQSNKCHVCSKTVYPMEFVGAADKAFHKACFKCLVCKTALKSTDCELFLLSSTYFSLSSHFLSRLSRLTPPSSLSPPSPSPPVS